MEGEIIILKKKDLEDMFEVFKIQIASRILSKIKTGKSNTNNNQVEAPGVKRLSTRQIKDMLGVSNSTFEKIQEDLPLHRTKTGRMFGYEHDMIIYLFREHPPYFDFSKFKEYISEESLMKYLNSL